MARYFFYKVTTKPFILTLKKKFFQTKEKGFLYHQKRFSQEKKSDQKKIKINAFLHTAQKTLMIFCKDKLKRNS